MFDWAEEIEQICSRYMREKMTEDLLLSMESELNSVVRHAAFRLSPVQNNFGDEIEAFNVVRKGVDGVELVAVYMVPEHPNRPPIFAHNHCDCCVYLGGFCGQDLYYCPQDGYPTVIARYGNEPQEYTSGLGFSEVNPHLAQAKLRAEKRGLLAGRAA